MKNYLQNNGKNTLRCQPFNHNFNKINIFVTFKPIISKNCCSWTNSNSATSFNFWTDLETINNESELF